MERRSTNETFEHLLRQNAEEFRMHPSPKVWKGISENLSKRKKRFYFGFISLLISSAILSYTIFDFSVVKIAQPNTPVLVPVGNPVKDVANGTTKLNRNTASIKLATGKPRVQSTSNVSLIASDANLKGSQAIEESSIPLENSLALQRQNWIAEILSTPGANPLNNLSFNKNFFDFNSINTSIPEEENSNVPVKPRSKSSKFGLMFFFTPTVSYRKLSENKSYLRSVTPIGVPYNIAALYDVNNAVTHKPNIGLEFGVTTKYSISKNIKLRGGLQFNINRYDIKAFRYVPEVATIALNNGSMGMQSVNTVSNYRNFNGAQTDWLQNFYFQVSTPIGAEIKLHGTEKMYVGAATTIQPTYVLGDRAYLITADYKNYAQVPWLMRRGNVNTSLETFVAYSTGKVNWQVGPQVRYQLLSSFVNKYPVKENLFDFGLKVGISVNQNQ
jgi:hypothetical protein